MTETSLESLETVLAAIDRSLRPGGEELRDTAASRRARQNRVANLAALEQRQSWQARILEKTAPLPLEWVFGRDGSLTGRDAAGTWWGGSSLPYRVGQSLLQSLEPAGAVGCFLAPATSGQIRAAFEKLHPQQAMLAVIPDEQVAAVILACEDFSADIHARRLWFACGERWALGLSRILEEQPGLSVPKQFIRTGLLEDDKLDELTTAANPVFSREIQRRAELATQIRARIVAKNWRGKPPCIVVRSRFRNWDFAGLVLAKIAGERPEWKQLDIDSPTTGSPLALALAVEDCGGVVAADLYRADMPNVVPDEMPWVVWCTDGRIAPFAAGSADRLLVTERNWIDKAIGVGWPADRVTMATWPQLAEATTPCGKQVALIGDAVLTDPPDKLRDFSSHGLLWEQIAAELVQNPHAISNDVDKYLSERAQRLNIPAETLDRTLFVEKLVLPAWRRGAAGALRQAGLIVNCHGAGWEKSQPVESFDQFIAIAQASASLVCPIPTQEVHAVDALGRPVIRAGSAKPSSARPIYAQPLSINQITAALSLP